MCEFCLQHGEGKKWYLQAKNYADDLLSDLRRRRFIEKFLSDPEALAREVHDIERLNKMPAFIRSIVSRLITRKMKKIHFGQIVPIEDIEQIFGFVNSIIRVACICRQASLGQEKRYCYGVSLSPDGGRFAEILQGLDQSFLTGPEWQVLRCLPKKKPWPRFIPMSRRASATASGPSTPPSSGASAIATAPTAWPCTAPSPREFR